MKYKKKAQIIELLSKHLYKKIEILSTETETEAKHIITLETIDEKNVFVRNRKTVFRTTDENYRKFFEIYKQFLNGKLFFENLPNYLNIFFKLNIINIPFIFFKKKHTESAYFLYDIIELHHLRNIKFKHKLTEKEFIFVKLLSSYFNNIATSSTLSLSHKRNNSYNTNNNSIINNKIVFTGTFVSIPELICNEIKTEY